MVVGTSRLLEFALDRHDLGLLSPKLSVGELVGLEELAWGFHSWVLVLVLVLHSGVVGPEAP